MTGTDQRLTCEQADRIVDACLAAAREADCDAGVAVVDADGEQLVAKRSERVRALTLRLATAKAYSAAIMSAPTRRLEDWQRERPTVLAALAQLGPYPVVPGDGGIPILQDGVLLGAVGMSGVRNREDGICERVLGSLGYDPVPAA